MPLLCSLKAIASGKYCYALAVAQANIVLPAFARSFFADRVEKKRYTCASLRGTKQSLQDKRLCKPGIATSLSLLAMTLVVSLR
ncbi:hypothetical protein [Mucilaginibacter conchicola]|uniref:hypothetical protein n=1 Tax=Mucilaginibacter conchicola TaxID=2303333 RepID=UPI0011C10A45|nr:hypothetical protein [Mucilaginibacter conchicola]